MKSNQQTQTPVMTTQIFCCDCGTDVIGKGNPKDVAKQFKWYHAAKGKWRCKECQAFLAKELR